MDKKEESAYYEQRIELLKGEHAELEKKIAEWILWRKVEAGAITASGLEQLDKAMHACSVVQQVVEDIKEITVLLAEATKLPKIAELVMESNGGRSEKYDKQILRDLENADAVAKSAAIFLLQAKDLILDADIKLKSTGWLSDRPPQIQVSGTTNLEKEATERDSKPEQVIQQSFSGPKNPPQQRQKLKHDAPKGTKSSIKQTLRTNPADEAMPDKFVGSTNF